MRKTLSIVLTAIMVMSLFCFGSSAAEGTAIKDAAGFAAMTADGTYYLDADITLDSTWGTTVDSSAVTAFEGTLDGNGHTVTISAPMFACFNGTVKNLTIAGSVTTDSDAAAFALSVTKDSGDNSNDGAKFINVTNKANVKGGKYYNGDTETGVCVGAFIARAESLGSAIFENCVNEGTITAADWENPLYEDPTVRIGGFCGRIDTCVCINCENKGDVISTSDWSRVGGFVGQGTFTASMNYIAFEYCKNSGSVKGQYAGGLLGYTGLGSNNCSYDYDLLPYLFLGCVNSGEITGLTFAGGMVGYVYANGSNNNQTFDMRYCVNTGALASARWISNFCAYSNSIYNTMAYNIGIGTMTALDAYTPPTETGKDPTTYNCWFAFLGCSSADYRTNPYIHDNYVVDDGKIQWTTYAESSSNEAKRMTVEEGLTQGMWTRITLDDLKDGKICYECNKKGEATGLYQTIGVDAIPTPFSTSKIVVLDGTTYKNGTTAEFAAVDTIVVTDPVEETEAETEPAATTEATETKAADTKAAETEAADTAAETAAETEAPADETTKAAEKSGCGSAVSAAVVLVAILGTAFVAKKH